MNNPSRIRAIAVIFSLISFSANAADQILRPDGLGPVQIGMTVAQAEKALRAKFDPLKKMSANTESCWYTKRADRVDARISYMVWFDKIVRIDIDATELGKSRRAVPAVATEKGIRIGASKAQIEAAYGSIIAVSPHEYGDENDHYWTILTKGKRRGIRFETLGGKVNSFHAGLAKAVKLVEGCS